MPTASSTLSVPSKLGTSPAAKSPGSTPTCSRSYMKPRKTMPRKPAIASSKRAVAARLQLEDREGHDRGHQARDERRHAEEQVERDRRADELGQVGRDRDRLGLQPQPERDGLLEVLAAQLRQVLAGGDAGLGRQVLHEHRHQVRGDDHPQQHVAVLGAARDVGGEVARVDVGDRGDEGGAEERDAAADAPARAGLAAAASAAARARRLAGARGLGQRRRIHARTRIEVASWPPSACVAPSTSTNSGPPNGCLSITRRRVPGTISRAAR